MLLGKELVFIVKTIRKAIALRGQGTVLVS
jgi:hypothetical protein